jgi:DNA transformation protein
MLRQMAQDDDTSAAGPAIDDGTGRIVALLAPIGEVSARRLFGTWGLYLDERIFGLMHGGVVYFRTCPNTIARYVSSGSQPFLYRRSDGRSTVMQYHEVPAHVLADPELACTWARDSLAIN